MKNVLTPPDESVLMALGLTAATSVANADITKYFGGGIWDYTDNLKWRNGWYHENH